MLDHRLIVVLEESRVSLGRPGLTGSGLTGSGLPASSGRRASLGTVATAEEMKGTKKPEAPEASTSSVLMIAGLGALLGGGLGWALAGKIGAAIGGLGALAATQVFPGKVNELARSLDGGDKAKGAEGSKPGTGAPGTGAPGTGAPGTGTGTPGTGSPVLTPGGLTPGATPPVLSPPAPGDLMAPGFVLGGLPPTAAIVGPPSSPAEVLARDPRPWANPAGVLGSNWVAERKLARFPASQKVVTSFPRPVYHPIVGFSGTPEAPIPVYSEGVLTLEPETLARVLEGLYVIDGITYWVGDPMTLPGTVSGMFSIPFGRPGEPSEGLASSGLPSGAGTGWRSDGAVPSLYLPTQGDLYLIQQAFMPAPDTTDPDREEAMKEIQQLLDGGGLRPLGPASATHMPPVIMNVGSGT